MEMAHLVSVPTKSSAQLVLLFSGCSPRSFSVLPLVRGEWHASPTPPTTPTQTLFTVSLFTAVTSTPALSATSEQLLPALAPATGLTGAMCTLGVVTVILFSFLLLSMLMASMWLTLISWGLCGVLGDLWVEMATVLTGSDCCGCPLGRGACAEVVWVGDARDAGRDSPLLPMEVT